MAEGNGEEMMERTLLCRSQSIAVVVMAVMLGTDHPVYMVPTSASC